MNRFDEGAREPIAPSPIERLSLVGVPTPFDDGARFQWQSADLTTTAIVGSSLFQHIFGHIPAPSERLSFVHSNIDMFLEAAQAKAQLLGHNGRTVTLDQDDLPASLTAQG